MSLYSCPTSACTSRILFQTLSGNQTTSVALASGLAPAAARHFQFELPAALAVNVSVTMNSFVLTPRQGIDRTTG